jgi:adenylate cyclase
MEYTAIGDTVNLASRLESLSKELGAEIVMSEHTYDAVRSLFRWKSAGELTVRGRSEPVRVFRRGNRRKIRLTTLVRPAEGRTILALS